MSKKDNNINNVDEADVNINDTDVTSDTDKDADTVEAQGSSDADVKAEKSDNASDAQGAEETVDINNKKDQKDAVIEDLQDRLKRQMAEFDNYRKRTIKEKSELILNGGQKVLESLLPVLDDLERAQTNMDKSDDVATLKEGVELIIDKLTKTLSTQGLSKIETDGSAFDTDFHEAIALVPVEDESKKNQIIDCVQTGYTLNGKVIRHAKVAVGQ